MEGRAGQCQLVSRIKTTHLFTEVSCKATGPKWGEAKRSGWGWREMQPSALRSSVLSPCSSHSPFSSVTYPRAARSYYGSVRKADGGVASPSVLVTDCLSALAAKMVDSGEKSARFTLLRVSICRHYRTVNVAGWLVGLALSCSISNGRLPGGYMCQPPEPLGAIWAPQLWSIKGARAAVGASPSALPLALPQGMSSHCQLPNTGSEDATAAAYLSAAATSCWF
ncbi:hypothetical protein GOODEAATRI_002888 [Goodea atripinnis]|uniref:Uncharacterized protein n=1 Tax=Goodea atripinnis TaxID=208336 RepID=A0ABV0MGK5_9TELE